MSFFYYHTCKITTIATSRTYWNTKKQIKKQKKEIQKWIFVHALKTFVTILGKN